MRAVVSGLILCLGLLGALLLHADDTPAPLTGAPVVKPLARASDELFAPPHSSRLRAPVETQKAPAMLPVAEAAKSTELATPAVYSSDANRLRGLGQPLKTAQRTPAASPSKVPDNNAAPTPGDPTTQPSGPANNLPSVQAPAPTPPSNASPSTIAPPQSAPLLPPNINSLFNEQILMPGDGAPPGVFAGNAFTPTAHFAPQNAFTPNGDCATCGPGSGGECGQYGVRPKTNCVACLICEPYPNCCNGCVNFCESDIFHENDCWLTSNNRCCSYDCNRCQRHGPCCGPCTPFPAIYATAEALVLTRDNQANNQTLVQQTGTGDALLNTGDFDFDWQTGFRAAFGYRPCKDTAWEFSYFGLQDWDENRTLVGAADLSLPGDLGLDPALDFGGDDSMSLTYSSIIHNGEVNYFWRHRRLCWLAGFRYFHLGEDFNFTGTNAAGGSSLYDADTTNNLYGGQLGVRLRGGWQRVGFDVIGKAGVFGNAMQQQQTIADFDGSVFRDTVSNTSRAAFVGEVGANVTVYLSKVWSIRGGYTALWVDRVALAADQLDFSTVPTSGTSIDPSGSVFFHGASLGIGCLW